MNAENIRLNVSHWQYPAHGLGYGRRMGIWLQSDTIPCSDCIVSKTERSKTERKRPEQSIALSGLINEWLEWLNEADGVTIAGGEPFKQPLALQALVKALRTRCFGDILVYSGYPWRKLEAEHGDVIGRVDAVASKRFAAAHPAERTRSGRAHPQVRLLTDLARERYADWPCFYPDFYPGTGIGECEGVIDVAGILCTGLLHPPFQK